MAFIGDCPDVAMLEDVLIAVLDLLRHTPLGRIPLLAGMSGAQLFASLLSREQPALRILGLHLLAHFVPYIQSGAQPCRRNQVARVSRGCWNFVSCGFRDTLPPVSVKGMVSWPACLAAYWQRRALCTSP